MIVNLRVRLFVWCGGGGGGGGGGSFACLFIFYVTGFVDQVCSETRSDSGACIMAADED